MTDFRASVRSALNAHADALKDLAMRIHRNPELGYEETQACAWQVALLRKWGFKVATPCAGLKTAYKATLGRGKPAFCLMSEYDALPEIGHACGHNLIAAAALGAGKAVAEVMTSERIPGELVVMGTPAEESRGGKVKMIAAGALKGLEAVMMAHPSWRTVPDTGCSAIKRFRVRFVGQASHAAASPEKARNALDAVMLVFQGVNAWRQQLVETSRIHGVVEEGGVVPNIIPGEASCLFYLRALSDEVLDDMVRRFENIVQGAALMTDTKPVIALWLTAYKTRIANGALNEAYMDAAGRAGLKPFVPEQSSRASSDFGDVSHILPAAHVYYSISRKEIPVHSPQFRKAAGSAYGLTQTLKAAESLALVALRFLTDEAFRNRVREGFDGRP